MNPVTLLIVEDEVLVRLVVAETLRDEGYHVLEAANADEAVTLLGSFSEIALVFTDIQMPGNMDGAGLASFVRENYPDLAIITTSGGPIRPKADEAVVFVPKPYQPDEIVKRIEALLQSRGSELPTGPSPSSES